MAEFKRNPIVVVAGPTASGKTSLAVALCKELNAEVVSADSMQIYEGMTIATAKPTEEEMQGVPHYMMGFLSPEEPYSVAAYCEKASKCIESIISRGKLPVVVGGTGLYINSLVDNIEFSPTKADYELREKLHKRAENEGAQVLLSELEKIDEETARTLHPNNLGRIIRALEIFYTTGITMTRQRELSRLNPSPYKPCMLLLTVRNRQVLYDRINKRVDIMIEKGLLDEAKTFLKSRSYADSTACQAIGYKELMPCIDGKLSLDECVESLKRQTRRYAKRQLTWFNRDERMEKIYIDECENFEEILSKATNIIKSRSVVK